MAAGGRQREAMAASGRRSSRWARGAFGEGWCWRIGVLGGVFLRNGSACNLGGESLEFLLKIGGKGDLSLWGCILRALMDMITSKCNVKEGSNCISALC
jgi:hypothetical protein